MGNIENIGTTISVILSAITLLTLLVNSPKKKILKWAKDQKEEAIEEAVKKATGISNDQFQELSEKMEKLGEAQRQVLRTSITNLYDKASIRGYLTYYEKKNLLEEFSTYKEVLHGNSYIEDLVETMKDFPVQDKK